MAKFGPVAVAIPTKNRPKDLDLTVETVLAQTVLPRQLIIIDQSGTDVSEQRVRQRYQASGGDLLDSLELIYHKDTSITGLTAARNCSLKFVRAKIVLFLDDDVILERDFIELVLAAYDKHADATGVSGVVTNYSPPSAAFRLWSRVFMRGSFWDDRQPVYWNAYRFHSSEPVRVTRLGGGLMSFRMSAIAGVRFDENLHGACDGEDVEFCARLDPNSVLLIEPKARLVHSQSPVARVNEHWLSKHASTMWYLYRRNWDYGIRNRFCFLWLNVGYAMAATLISVCRRSLASWRGLAKAIRASQALVVPEQQR
jgi:GT2 family glycosyltransferase